jgi:hypothetical protein
MRDQTFTEEGGDATSGSIDKLVGDDEIERLVFFFQ